MPQKNEIHLATNLKRLMQERGVSLSHLAHQVGMNKTTLHNYCHGTAPRSLKSLQLVANFFDVPLAELLLDTTVQPSSREKPCNTDSLALRGTALIAGKYEVIIRPIDNV